MTLSSKEDENSDPVLGDSDSESQKNECSEQKKVKPLVPPNEQSHCEENQNKGQSGAASSRKPTPSRRKSYLENKYERNFQKSGMQKGALLNYFTKKDPNDIKPARPEINISEDNVSSNNSKPQIPHDAVVAVADVPEVDNDDCSSQGSDIIFLGVFPTQPKKKVITEIDLLTSDEEARGSEDEIVSLEREEFLLNSSGSEDGNVANNVNDIPKPSSPTRHRGSDGRAREDQDMAYDESFVPLPRNEVEEQDRQNDGTDNSWSDSDSDRGVLSMNSLEKVRSWQIESESGPDSEQLVEDEQREDGCRLFKRARLEENESGPTSSTSVFQTKDDDKQADNLVAANKQDVEHQTPPNQASSSQLKILNVTGAEGESLNQQSAMISSSKSGFKRNTFIYEVKDNTNVAEFIKKNKWGNAAMTMKGDFTNNHCLPTVAYLSQLIQRVLLENTRVSKDDQGKCWEFLRHLMSNYTVSGDKANFNLMAYYINVFEKVFEYNNTNVSYSGAHYFFKVLIDRVSNQDKNSLRLLNLVTKLVVSQYQQYEKIGAKLRPPLFQYFLEAEVGNFKYHACKPIVKKLFANSSWDEFCIYLKWLDLIAKRFGFSLLQSEYSALVEDVVSFCEKREDLGLLIFLNSNHQSFVNEVCWKILDHYLTVIYAPDENNDEATSSRCGEVTEVEKKEFLANLANSLFIKPALLVISDLREELCMVDYNLKFVRPALDCVEEDIKRQSASNSNRGRNAKGETKLHIMCSQKRDPTLEELKSYLRQFPAHINAQDNYGNTPLHDCCKNNKGDVLVHLIDLHIRRKLKVPINFFLRNKGLETPVHLAAVYCQPVHVKLLGCLISYCQANDVLMFANGDGKLPFELSTNPSIRNTLKPEGYGSPQIWRQGGYALSPICRSKIQDGDFSFPLKKLIAFWNSNRIPTT